MNAKRIACKAAKTLAVFLISVLVLSLLVFVVSRLAPGDPLVAFYGERAEKLKPAERAAAEARLGLDQPILRQYALWLKGALRGEFGISYKYKMDVLEVIRARLPFTLRLGGIGFLLTFFLALGLGVLCARHEDKGLDRALCKIGTVTSCIPEFWMSLMLILIFAVSLRVLPSSGAYDVGKADDLGSRITHLILPLTVVVLGHGQGGCLRHSGLRFDVRLASGRRLFLRDGASGLYARRHAAQRGRGNFRADLMIWRLDFSAGK